MILSLERKYEIRLFQCTVIKKPFITNEMVFRRSVDPGRTSEFVGQEAVPEFVRFRIDGFKMPQFRKLKLNFK